MERTMNSKGGKPRRRAAAPAALAPTLRVMKFGGTSVASAERFRRVADLVGTAADGERVVVVVSAVAGVTNRLLAAIDSAVAGETPGEPERFRATHADIAQELLGELGEERRGMLLAEIDVATQELRQWLGGMALLGDATARARARTAALGERLSAAILTALLAARRGACDRLDPQVLLACSGDPLDADPRPDEIRRRAQAWRRGDTRLAVMPGFFAGDESGELVLLGRGGSDYSAALLAQALDARLLEIWTDVPGVFTADPRVVPAARVVAEVSFEEAMELAHFGAKILHPKSVGPARAAGIPVRICDTFNPAQPGTLLRRRDRPARRIACGLSLLPGVTLMSLGGTGMKGLSTVAARAFAALSEHGIAVLLITQGSNECILTLGLRTADTARAVHLVREAFVAEIATGRMDAIELRPDLAILSLVGDGMRQRSGVSARFFGALGDIGANVAAIAQGGSERSICVALDAKDGAAALRAAHARFFEDGAVRDEDSTAARFTPRPADSSKRRRFAVFAPASIGNLAAGFDVLGVAIAPLGEAPLGDVVEVSLARHDTLIASGPFAEQLPADAAENLVWRARDAVARQLGEELPPLEIRLRKGLPVGSGLGSSAASVVAAVVAIDELLGGSLGVERRLRAAGEAEGHASGSLHLDNVAPVLLGGVRLVVPHGIPRLLPWPGELTLVLIQPAIRLTTREARAALPSSVSLPLAVSHAQNLAALLVALNTGDHALLAASLRDFLAEPHRAALVPGFREVQSAALAAGALGCSFSGAGPAIFAVAESAGAEAVARAGAAAWKRAGVGCQWRLCEVDRQGARPAEEIS
jgi:homoserine kinase